MAQHSLWVTDARLSQALPDAKRDLLQLDGHAWTQENQDHFDEVVKVAMRREIWYSVEEMSTYIYAMFHRMDPDGWAPPCW
eukprot:SAG11_NODE_9816_length_878_cov_3.716303_1_plen_81_part_00